MARIAHVSDPHLAPLPRPTVPELAGKRLSGYLSWIVKRRSIHLRSVLDLVVADVKRARPDHVALTGDLINISLKAEYVQARAWLEGFGSPDWITVAPGNHDAYIPMAWDRGPGLWADYFASEPQRREAGGSLASYFPLVRFRKTIAVVAVSTAVPTAVGVATGILGPEQLERIETVLADLRQRGFYRLLLIHHPPLRRLAPARKELLDGDRLRTVLEAEGCELVIYGHNHLHQRAEIASAHGPVHMIGIPSASQIEHHGCTAAWNLYDIKRQAGAWTTDVTTRSFDPKTRSIVTSAQFQLVHSQEDQA